MGWTPTDPQRQVLDAVARSYRAQFERRGYQRDELTEADLWARARQRREADVAAGRDPMDERDGALRPVWLPGDGRPAFIFRVESGHGIGKTKLVAGLLNHGFDTFESMNAYAYGTDWAALRDKTMREVFEDRRGKALPGRILEGNLRVFTSNSHFIQARSTSDAKGRGKDRLHGNHPEFWIYAVDEADAAEQYTFDAIDANTAGGIGIVLLIGNPRRRLSRFAKMKGKPGVISFRFSTHEAINVVTGREVIPNAVEREWVRKEIVKNCQVTEGPDDSKNRFRLDWYTVEGEDGTTYSPWLEPNDEYRYMVLGIPPVSTTENTFVAPGTWDAAVYRGQGAPAPEYGWDGFTAAADVARLYALVEGTIDHPGRLTLGVDVARWGRDSATVYARFRGRVWRVASLAQSNTADILAAIDRAVSECREIGSRLFAVVEEDDGREREVRFPLARVVVRVDNSGGGGSGVVDKVVETEGTVREDLAVSSVEVLFNALAYGDDVDGEADARTVFHDLVTQLYAFTGEALKTLRLGGAGRFVPDTAERDLTDRRYRFAKVGAHDRKRIEGKDVFKKRNDGESPDDGDGLALVAAHDSAFGGCPVATNGGTAGAGGVA